MTDEMADPTRGIRIGDTERNRAAEALGEHLRAGRLFADEYDDRLQRAFGARTAADVDPLFADLPGGSPLTGPAGPYPQRWAPRRRGWSFPFYPPVLIVLLVAAAIAWVATTHLPPFFLVALLFLAFARRRAFGAGHPGAYRGQAGHDRRSTRGPDRHR